MYELAILDICAKIKLSKKLITNVGLDFERNLTKFQKTAKYFKGKTRDKKFLQNQTAVVFLILELLIKSL